MNSSCILLCCVEYDYNFTDRRKRECDKSYEVCSLVVVIDKANGKKSMKRKFENRQSFQMSHLLHKLNFIPQPMHFYAYKR